MEDLDRTLFQDKRSKYWRVKIYFWLLDDPGPELVAETEKHVIHGTAEILELIESYSEELYGVVLWELRKKYVKNNLLHFRINLSNRGHSCMRVAYDYEGKHHAIQVDAFRVNSPEYQAYLDGLAPEPEKKISPKKKSPAKPEPRVRRKAKR